MAFCCAGSDVLMSESNLRTPRTDIVFREQYVETILGTVYGAWMPNSMCGYIDDVSCENPFVGKTYGNWSNEAPSKLEDFMHQNNDLIDSHDYIDLGFDTAIYPIRISIIEKSHPGAVVRVWAWNNLTTCWQKLWSGLPQVCPNKNRIFTPPLAICKFKTNRIRLELNYNLTNYYTQLKGALLFGTEDLLLPKNDIQDHRLINVIPTWCDTECAIPEKTNDTHNLTRHISDGNSFFSDLNNIKSIITKNYVIWKFNEKDYSRNSSPIPVETAENQEQRNLNDFPDETLLKILGYLDFKSLVRCSQLNNRFNLITRDKKLHRSLNLKPYWNCIDDTTIRYLEERCNGLKRIDLSWCNNISAESFITFLRKCGEGLTHLRLNVCDFVTHKVINAIAKNCPHLKELCLRSCSPVAEYDFRFLKELKFLECLDLHNDCLRNDQLNPIIRNNRGLRNLNLGAGWVRCIDDVMAAISEFCPHIEILNLSSQVDLTDIGIKRISRCTNLRELDIGDCSRIASGWDSLGELFKNCRSLEKVFAGNLCCLRDSIVEPLLQCKKLKQLDITWSKVFPELVDQMFTSWPELRLLDLSICKNINELNVQKWRELYPQVSIKFESD